MDAKSRMSVNSFFEMSSGKILGDKATLGPAGRHLIKSPTSGSEILTNF